MTPQKLKIHVRFNKRKKKTYKVSGKNWKSKKNPNTFRMTKQTDAARQKPAKPTGTQPQSSSDLLWAKRPFCTLRGAHHNQTRSLQNLKPLKTHFKLESRQYTWWSMFKWQKKRDSFPINTNLLQINEWHGWKMRNWTASVTSERLCFHF